MLSRFFTNILTDPNFRAKVQLNPKEYLPCIVETTVANNDDVFIYTEGGDEKIHRYTEGKLQGHLLIQEVKGNIDIHILNPRSYFRYLLELKVTKSFDLNYRSFKSILFTIFQNSLDENAIDDLAKEISGEDDNTSLLEAMLRLFSIILNKSRELGITINVQQIRDLISRGLAFSYYYEYYKYERNFQRDFRLTPNDLSNIDMEEVTEELSETIQDERYIHLFQEQESLIEPNSEVKPNK